MFRRTLILLISLALTACEIPGVGGDPATASPTALPLTESPTDTMTPIPTPTASSTPFPALSGNKPYLIIKQSFYGEKLFVYDQDGREKQTLQLPTGGKIHTYYGSKLPISPDGKWLAFYTGSVQIGGDADNLPLTLRLLNITDGTIRKVSDVVTEGYHQKLSEVADQIHMSPELAFLETIYSIAWSPDSRSLAFAGQIDGLSSDVYLYEIESMAVQRVNDDIQSVAGIEWSPDGEKIVFRNSIPAQTYIGSTLHVVKPGEKVIKDPKTLYSGTWWSAGSWLSPNLLLVNDGSDTAGDMNLRTLDINTQQKSHLWKDLYGEYVIDNENQIIAITSSDSDPDGEDWGLFFVTFDGKQKKVSNTKYYELKFRGGNKNRFIARDDTSIFGIDKNGTNTLVGEREKPATSISPDYSWMLIYNDQGIDIYDKDDILIRTLAIPGIYQILWRPDSKAVFYSTGREIYYLPLPAGEPVFVDHFDGDDFNSYLDDSVWLP